MKKNVLCLLLIFLITLLPLMALANPTASIDGDQREKDSLDKDIRDTRDLLEDVIEEQEEIKLELEALEAEIEENEEELALNEAELLSVQGLLEEARASLEQAQRECREFEELVSERLQAIYMMEDSSYIELLLGSKNINEFIDRLTMIRFMISSDNKMFDELEALRQEIDQKKKNLEEEEISLKESKEEIKRQKIIIEEKKLEREELLVKLEEEERQYRAELEALERASREIGNKIKNFIAQYEAQLKREQEAAKKEEVPPPSSEKSEETPSNETEGGQEEGSSGGSQDDGGTDEGEKPKDESPPKDDNSNKGEGEELPEEKPSDDEDVKDGESKEPENSEGPSTSGALLWPTPGFNRITSPFGYRYHPVDGKWKGHNGIDIGKNLSPLKEINGTNAVAADDGIVITSEYSSSYGNYIVIYHGNNISTTYAHGSKRLVSVGQDVKRGQAVLVVGSTGISTAPHLHFEVRVNGNPVDPMSYLNR